ISHLAYHDQAGVNADADLKGWCSRGVCRGTASAWIFPLAMCPYGDLYLSVQVRQSRKDFQPRPHGAPRVSVMRSWIAKVDQQPVTQILGNIALKAGNDLSRGRLIGSHHLAQVFGVELRGECSRVH